MLVKCPVCQTEYDLEPGKYECKCGAKFFVDGSGATAEVTEPSAIEDSDETITLGHHSEFADAVEGQNAKGANRKNGKGMWFALAGVIIVLAVIGISYGCHQSAKAQRIAEEQRIAAEKQRIAEEKRLRDLKIRAEQQAKKEAESAAAKRTKQDSASESNPDKNKTSTPKTAEPGQYHADIQGLLKAENLLKNKLVLKPGRQKTFNKPYSVPFIVRAVCRTDGVALRFKLLKGEIIFANVKGAYQLEINVSGLKKKIRFSGNDGWFTVEIKVTASELSVYVDGKLQYTGKGNFENKKSPFLLKTLRVGNDNGTISVKQLSVLTPVSSLPQGPVSQPQGAAQPASESNPDKNMTSTSKTAEPEQGKQKQGQYHADIQGLLKADNLLKNKLVMKQNQQKNFNKTYSVPFIVRAVCRTDGVALRFKLLGGEILFGRGKEASHLEINVLGLKKNIRFSRYDGWATVEIKVTASE
ncbi:MAG: hypothetical protein IKO93_15145, partial [Lentisphaeria bacterium]|nr:hypothetical protein [Lentisphaeria bacterium]